MYRFVHYSYKKLAFTIFLEQENELVALIPFSDKRLKPRRT